MSTSICHDINGKVLIIVISSSFIMPEGSKISHKNTELHTQNMTQNYT